jgi:hypothetical protein
LKFIELPVQVGDLSEAAAILSVDSQMVFGFTQNPVPLPERDSGTAGFANSARS